MISILIIVLLVIVSYAPYNYYQKKANLKITAKSISQVLQDSKTKAISWLVWVNSNLSIWVYFTNDELWNNKIKMFWYPYNIDELNITNIENTEIKLLKTYKLKKDIVIDKVWWKDNLLIFFNSINWEAKYYTFDSWLKTEVIENKIIIDFSYNHTTSDNLKRKIEYITDTNTIFY